MCVCVCALGGGLLCVLSQNYAEIGGRKKEYHGEEVIANTRKPSIHPIKYETVHQSFRMHTFTWNVSSN